MLPLRRLLSAPTFSIFAVLTLSLGIGGTVATYAVAEAVLFRPLDIDDVDRVVNIYHHDPSRVSAGHLMALSWPDAQDIARSETTFSAVMFWSRFMMPLAGRGAFTPLLGELVSGNYFSFVGAEPLLGRTLQPADDEPGAPAVVVISESLWRTSFLASPDVVGQVVTIGRESCVIVGVMPASFRGVDMPNVMPTKIWAPLALAERLGSLRDATGRHDREERWVLMKGRLASGRTVGEAATEVAAIGRQLDEAHPIGSADRRAYGRPEDARNFAVIPASAMHAHESVDPFAVPTAQAVLGSAALVLLVACTNLANLLLARGTRRQHEVAVRRALGATRAQVVGALMQDSVRVAIAGGAGGLVVATWLMTLLSGSLSVGQGLAIAIEPRLTPGVVAVALAATAAATLVFAVIPAWHVTRGGLRHLLDAQTGGAVARWRGRRILIGIQVAISAALLAPGALLLQQALAKTFHDPGFALARLAAAQVNYQMIDRAIRPADTAAGAAGHPERLDVMTEAVARLRRVPGIEHVTLVSRLPVYFNGSTATLVDDEPVAPPDRQSPTPPDIRRVAYITTGDTAVFDTLGLPLVSGRGFGQGEVESAVRVVVISRGLARTIFGSDAAVGRTLFLGTDPYEVVGVAADTDWSSIGRRTYGSVYRPGRPDPARPMVIAARAADDPDLALGALRTILRDLDPELPVIEAVTGAAIASRQTMFDRIGAQVVWVFGGFALVLALTGLAGLLTFIVTSRRREIGVRMALGADRRRIVRLIVGQGLRPVIYGGAVGLAAGAGLSYLVGVYFYRLPEVDWVGLTIVSLVLIPAAAVASYLPARRAAAVDPNVTLREL